MRAALAVRSMPVRLPSGAVTATVVGVDGLPIDEVETFLGYLRTVGSSRNTVTAYARHLALWFRWLIGRGVSWEQLDFEGLCMFVQDLADGTVPALHRVGKARPTRPRSRATQEAVLAAVCSFLDYWRLEGRGPRDLALYRQARTSGQTAYRFLAHVEARRGRLQRRIRVKGPKSPAPRIVAFEDDFARLVAAAGTARDRTLLSALYDGGLRIGQALGLRHEDLDIARHRVTVVRRENNTNAALSKQRATFTVDMPARFFDFYGQSLVDEQLPLGIDSDYVFVTLSPGRFLGRPMTYANAIQRVKAIGTRAGVALTPHTLRHTHGTALAKASWSAPEIAKRLGHSNASSADVYIHLVEGDIADKYRATFGDRLDP
jgi:integrase/recombinase XerD